MAGNVVAFVAQRRERFSSDPFAPEFSGNPVGDFEFAHVGVYVRGAECDGQPVNIGGIGNVKTNPAARGRGLASLGIRRAIEFFHEQPAVAFALLVCEPGLIDYYARLGWREFGGQLLVRQHGARSEFTLNRVMTHPIQTEAPDIGVIDLCGPPW